MSENKLVTFGTYIRDLRKNAGQPLRKIAAQLDIDPSLLGKIERSERQPTKEQISKLALIFNQDETLLISQNLSDQIAGRIIEEDADINILRLAEEKVNYIISKKNAGDTNTYRAED